MADSLLHPRWLGSFRFNLRASKSVSNREFLRKAGARPGVANLALTQHANSQQHRIPVAISPRRNHL
jgi:hypothetical protein